MTLPLNVKDAFEACGAIVPGHFVYTSKKHGPTYVNKDALALYPDTFTILCEELAGQILQVTTDFTLVAAPATGGIAPGQVVAQHLCRLTGRRIRSVYADQAPNETFVFRRGYGIHVRGAHVLVVEDILNSGKSGRSILEAVKECDGTTTAVAALCNRGGVTADSLNVPHIISLLDLSLEAWPASECILCQAGRPVDTDLGHGAEFLASRPG